MWNPPTKKQLEKIPDLYSTEGTPAEEKKIYMKFFMGGWTWYIAEISHKNWDTMFGYVVSPLEPRGEWGYISLNELKSIKKGFIEVDREIHGITPYTPVKFKEIQRRRL